MNRRLRRVSQSARLLVRTPIAAFTSLVLVFLVGVPAMAATWDYTRNSAVGLNPGQGRTIGTVTFGTTGEKVSFYGRTTDLCPADGVGTSFYLWVPLSDGTNRFSAIKAIDTSGCGDGWSAIEGGNMHTTGGRKMLFAEATLCWTNGGIDCWATALPAPPRHDNPYVP